jgi:hypothetical protein
MVMSLWQAWYRANAGAWERKFVESDPLEAKPLQDESVLAAITPSLAYEKATNLRTADWEWDWVWWW